MPDAPASPLPRVSVHVLGPVQVRIDGSESSVGGPVPRALLSRLIIAAGETVSDDTLIDDLWGPTPPPSARTTLQGYVARLRRILEPDRSGAPPRVLVRRGRGYALEVGEVDCEQFVMLSRRGKALLAAGDAGAAAETLDAAFALWRGSAHADVADLDFAAAEAGRLEDLRAAAFEDRMAAALVLGEHAPAAAQLTAFTVKHPLRERSWELLAVALYRSGRQGDALEALRRAREVLAEELGADPRPSLLAVQSAILAHDDAALGAHSPMSEAPDAPERDSSAPDPLTHNIPLPLSPLVGRSGQLAEIDALLRAHRLVTLTGTGGMGKTRLALESARIREDADGPWLVELAGAQDISQVTGAVATALGLTSPGGATALGAVLRERELLLILDNCEQVLDPVAEVVSTLLSRCPMLRILTTSREALGAPGELVHEIPPLSDGRAGEAVTLFVQRAAAQLGGFEPDDTELELLAILCTELDGMPLAIELAAAQCRTLSVQQLIANIDDRFAVLRGGPRTNARHRTMLAAVDWSYQTLSPSEALLFQSLAIFDGGFDLDAAGAIADTPDLLVDLGSLVDKSLVMVVGGDPRRYRMLETLRGYAARIREPEYTAQVRARHTRWVCELADAAYHGLREARSVDWMRRLELENANVRAALDANVHDDETYLRIAGGVYWYWFRAGHVAEALTHLKPALLHYDCVDRPTVSVPVQGRATAGLMVIRYLAGDLAGLMEAFGRLTDLADTAQDPAAHADAAVMLAFFEAGSGLTDQARAHAESALDFAVRTESRSTAAEALMCLGTADFRAGDFEAAGRNLGQAAQVAAECRYGWCEASALWIDAKTDLAQERWGGPAEHKLARMLHICESNADVTSRLVALATLAYALFRRGDHDAAAQLTGLVDQQGALIGYKPQAMDPIDLARYDDELRAGIPEERLEAGATRGRTLTRAQVWGLAVGSLR
ncbi:MULTISPECIES: BTAD domain-containing putative transcriptional regulator [Rhodococcus]|uniref:AfsR/SARP family transcriptional regulator n=1 Tax=Rhodococcus TaxID=1827 RepID=UPI0015C7D984|nr:MULTISPECIES: BTAD domain-containing putative transcriptional regulator [Rhodococcus]MCZ4556962.1 BTAD domain-containing putative transcriptional regulator [Rhodococcus maanshanensis]